MAKTETKKALVPKRRFPEFRGEVWRQIPLKKLGKFNGGGTPSKENNSFWSGDIPWVSSSDIEEDSIFDIKINRYITEEAIRESATKKVPANSILLVSRVGVGKLAITRRQICTSQDFTNFTPADGDLVFLGYLLKSAKSTLLSFNQGTSIKGFTKDNISKFEFPIPSPAEQRKIAECLTSLDEVIAGQGQRVEALKAHRKGLMQQLFPRDGETTPRLRFPEFQDAGEWESVGLDSMTSKVGSGITPRGGNSNYRTEGLPFLRSQNVGWGELLLDDIAFIDEETHNTFASSEIENEDVLLNITGASIGRSAIADSRIVGGNVNQHVCIIRTIRKKLIPAFLNQYLISQYGQMQIDSFQAGGNRQGLNFAQIRSFEVPVPRHSDGEQPSEQQRIAECLSSLDELITAHTEKLEALKTFKKGLMQQLFPAPEEDDA